MIQTKAMLLIKEKMRDELAFSDAYVYDRLSKLCIKAYKEEYGENFIIHKKEIFSLKEGEIMMVITFKD